MPASFKEKPVIQLAHKLLHTLKIFALYLLIGCSFLAMIGMMFDSQRTDYLSLALIPPNLKQLAPQSIMAFLVTLVIGAMILEAVQHRRDGGSYPRYSNVVYMLSKPIMILCSLQLVFWWLGDGPKAGAERYVLYSYAAVGLVGVLITRYGYLKPNYRQAPAATPVHGQGNGQQEEEPDVGQVKRPTATFKNIYGYAEVKDRIKDAARQIIHARASKDGSTKAARNQTRNGIMFFGEPGNGKTAFAEALAGEFRLPLVTLTLPDVESKWVGEKAQRVAAAFTKAKRNAPCVFFIDEIDSLMGERTNIGSGVAETDNNNVVNALLTLMVDLRASKVILVAATNHMDRLDGAGVREGRFDFKIEITSPDLEARVGLLKKGLQDNLSHIKASNDVVEMVAQRWNGFSAKRILAVTEELPSYLKRVDKRTLGFDEFMGALRSIQGRKGVQLENVKPLNELVLSPDTREMIDMLIGRMADPVHTESHGGTMPTGVLLHGAPGTGKTAAAKAIAKEIDWAFLPTTGSDMARDTKALEKLFAQAKELRPCIIFIDEADELMKERTNSMSTDATNKLLTLMDGVGDRVRDVVWFAATNHPDQIDSALLRGGRFTEKVVFEKPGAAGLNAHFQGWFERKKVTLDASLANADFSAIVGDESIANAEAVAQAALNRAIARRQPKVVVTREDLERAVLAVL